MESFVLLQDVCGIASRVFHFEQISSCLPVRVKIQVGQVGNCSESVYFFHKIFGASSSIVVGSFLVEMLIEHLGLENSSMVAQS